MRDLRSSKDGFGSLRRLLEGGVGIIYAVGDHSPGYDRGCLQSISSIKINKNVADLHPSLMISRTHEFWCCSQFVIFLIPPRDLFSYRFKKFKFIICCFSNSLKKVSVVFALKIGLVNVELHDFETFCLVLRK